MEPELDEYGLPIEANTRPAPEALVEQAIAKRTGRPKLRGLAKALDDFTGGDPEQVNALIKEVEEAAAQVAERGSPLTRKLVLHTKKAYEFAVEFLSKGEVDNPWTYEVVKQFAISFLELRARVAKGKKGGLVKAATVLGWYSSLLVSIVQNTHDPATGFKMGARLLYKEGFASILLDRVKKVSETLKLDRHTSKNRKNCGLPEAQMIIEHLIKSSVHRGRMTKLQLIVVVILCISCGIRPSSLCAGCKEDEEAGKLMKMGDFRLWNRGQLAVDVEMNMNNLKWHNATVLGTSMNFWFKALTKTHNMLFDTFWIVIYIWARGCLGHYPTFHDLLTTRDAELIITSPDEPFLLAPNKGGTQLTDKPWTTKGLGAALTAGGNGCGLEDVTTNSFRRGFANTISIVVGTKEASMALGHKEGHSVVTRHYSNGAGNLDVLGIVTGEATDQFRPGAETNLQMRVRTGMAVLALSKTIAQSNRMDDDDDDDDVAKASEKVGKAKGEFVKDYQEKYCQASESHEDEELQAYEQLMADKWDAYLDTFGRGTRLYKVAKGYKKTQISIIDTITKHRLYTEAASDPQFLARAKKARETNTGYRKCKQSVRRKGKEQGENEWVAASAENVASIEDTDTAVAHVGKDSALLDEASNHEPTSKSVAAAVPGPSAPRDASGLSAEGQARLQELSRDEEEDEDQVAGARDELRKFKQNNLAGKKHNQEIDEFLGDNGEPDPGEWKDKDEVERIPIASACDMRISLACVALDPILFARELQAQIEADDGKILCQKCRLHGDEVEFKNTSHLKRHLRQQHTEWSDLVPKMKCGRRFMCPGACGSREKFDSIEEVYDHCVSDDCPDQEAFKMMRLDHDAQHERRYQDQKKYEQEGGNARNRAVHRQLYHEYVQGLAEDDLLELADEYEIDRAEVEPYVGLMLKNLHLVTELDL